MRICIAAFLALIPVTSFAQGAHVDDGAAYLPDRMMSMMPELEAAISLVASTHPGCVSIDNASFSETYATASSPAFFVSCTMSGKSFEFQNVYVQGGKIIGTTP